MVGILECIALMKKYKVPSNYVKPDINLCEKGVMLDIYLFDDFLHKIYGTYEDEGKNMDDIFHIFFTKEDYPKAIEIFFGGNYV